MIAFVALQRHICDCYITQFNTDFIKRIFTCNLFSKMLICSQFNNAWQVQYLFFLLLLSANIRTTNVWNLLLERN